MIDPTEEMLAAGQQERIRQSGVGITFEDLRSIYVAMRAFDPWFHEAERLREKMKKLDPDFNTSERLRDALQAIVDVVDCYPRDEEMEDIARAALSIPNGQTA